MLPVAATFLCDAGWPRRFMLVYTLVLIASMPLGLLLFHVNRGLSDLCIQVFYWGSGLSMLVGNFMAMQSPTR